ncbi:MAG: Mur ligase domain-containing protein, partial [Chitinophagaceae bacterium]|nr:Mur ligase domain-containing protein [Chitinophagaceae bacterium]
MPILQDILYKVSLRSVQGSTAVDVDSLHIDSREVKPGGCFIAVRGVSSDGHMHIPAALDKGARVIVCEDLPEERREGVTYVQVANSAEATGYMAHEFYGRPSGQLKLVGVTGTNGKTTIATLLFKLLTELDHICGLVSTVQNQIGNA